MNDNDLAYRRILVALDGSDESEMVLPHVEAIAWAFGATVTLIAATESLDMVIAHTMPATMPETVPLIVDPTPVVEEEHREAASYLGSIAARLRAQGISANYQHPEGSPADAILLTAERLPADLIAMTTHGRGGLGRLVFGSVADEVLRKAPCPMLLVRVDVEEKEVVRDKALASATVEEAADLQPVV